MRHTLLVLVAQCVALSYGLPSILDIIASNNASTLLSLVNQAGLADTLRQGGKLFILFRLQDTLIEFYNLACAFTILVYLKHHWK